MKTKVVVCSKVPLEEKEEIERRAEENGMNLSKYVTEGLWLEELYLERPFMLLLTALRRIFIGFQLWERPSRNSRRKSGIPEKMNWKKETKEAKTSTRTIK